MCSRPFTICPRIWSNLRTQIQMIRLSPTKSVLSLSEPAVVETKQSVNLLCYSPWTLNELYIYNNSCKCSTKHATTAHPFKIKEAYFPTFMQTELKTKERCYEHFEAYIYIVSQWSSFWILLENMKLVCFKRDNKQRWKVLWAAVNCSLTGSYWRHWLRLLDMHFPKKLLMKGPCCIHTYIYI